MKTAVIYCRVSTEDQVKNTSLEQQEKDCTAYCLRNNLKIKHIYRDAGESARTADRPEFQKMMMALVRDRFDFVVVWKLDRFARDIYDQAKYLKEMAAVGTDIHSATENLDNTPAGKLMKTMLGGINQYYSDVNSERSRLGMKSMATAGAWTHQAPIGYITARKGNMPILVADPERGPAIYELFSRIATGLMRVRDAHEWLSDKLGIKIYAQGIHRILRQPVYAGVVQNRLTEYQPVKAVFPGLITQDTFDRVQLILHDGGFTQQAHPASQFPLRGVLKCSECGRMLTASFSRSCNKTLYPYYHCRCGLRLTLQRAQNGIDVYLDSVSKYMSELMPMLKEVCLETWDKSRAEALKDHDKAEKQLKDLEARKARLLDLYLSGGIDEPSYKQKLAEIGMSITITNVKAREADIDQTTAETVLIVADKMFQDVKTLFGRTPVSIKQAFINGIFGGPLTISPKCQVSNYNKDNIINILQQSSDPAFPLVPLTGIGSNSFLIYFRSIMPFSHALAA